MNYPRIKVSDGPSGEGLSVWVRHYDEGRWHTWSPCGDFFGSALDPENEGLTDEQVAAWPEAIWPAQITLTKDTPPQGSAPISTETPR